MSRPIPLHPNQRPEATPRLANAASLERESAWLIEVLEARMAHYFEDSSDPSPVSMIGPPDLTGPIIPDTGTTGANTTVGKIYLVAESPGSTLLDLHPFVIQVTAGQVVLDNGLHVQFAHRQGKPGLAGGSRSPGADFTESFRNAGKPGLGPGKQYLERHAERVHIFQ